MARLRAPCALSHALVELLVCERLGQLHLHSHHCAAPDRPVHRPERAARELLPHVEFPKLDLVRSLDPRCSALSQRICTLTRRGKRESPRTHDLVDDVDDFCHLGPHVLISLPRALHDTADGL